VSGRQGVALSDTDIYTGDSELLSELFPVVFPIRRSGSRPPLFCLPPLTGVGMAYDCLYDVLPEDQPIYAFNSPLLSGQAPAPASLDALSRRYIAQMIRLDDGGRCHLLGWSFGGYVAHRMAQMLESMNLTVLTLTLLDVPPTHAEHIYGAGPRTDEQIGAYIDCLFPASFFAQVPMRPALLAECRLNSRLLLQFERRSLRASLLLIEAERATLPTDSPFHMQNWWGLSDAPRSAYLEVPYEHQHLLGSAAMKLIGPRLRQQLTWADDCSGRNSRSDPQSARSGG
jgi:pimeloyl-ACP methyl ester carboxylesterase